MWLTCLICILKCVWIFFSICLDLLSALNLHVRICTIFYVWLSKFDMQCLYVTIILCVVRRFDEIFVCLCICNDFDVWMLVMFVYLLCVCLSYVLTILFVMIKTWIVLLIVCLYTWFYAFCIVCLYSWL